MTLTPTLPAYFKNTAKTSLFPGYKVSSAKRSANRLCFDSPDQNSGLTEDLLLPTWHVQTVKCAAETSLINPRDKHLSAAYGSQLLGAVRRGLCKVSECCFGDNRHVKRTKQNSRIVGLSRFYYPGATCRNVSNLECSHLSSVCKLSWAILGVDPHFTSTYRQSKDMQTVYLCRCPHPEPEYSLFASKTYVTSTPLSMFNSASHIAVKGM